MEQERPIGIFDSGIGGVTVLKEILKILPNENYIYYSDSRNNPYGDKSDEEIKKICDSIVEFFITQNCKAIVIACNTASANASKYLRERYANIPIIAIEPAYKMVFDNSYDDTTIVMATKATIESKKFDLLFNQYNNHKTILLPCIGLADLIEEGNKDKIEKYLERVLNEYKGKVKNVVLGCTHYPLVKKQINQVLGDVQFFDGAPFLAKHLKDILQEKNCINKTSKNGNIEFIDSSRSKEKEKRFFNIINM